MYYVSSWNTNLWLLSGEWKEIYRMLCYHAVINFKYIWKWVLNTIITVWETIVSFFNSNYLDLHSAKVSQFKPNTLWLVIIPMLNIWLERFNGWDNHLWSIPNVTSLHNDVARTRDLLQITIDSKSSLSSLSTLSSSSSSL